jgi:hypothetical protein
MSKAFKANKRYEFTGKIQDESFIKYGAVTLHSLEKA